MINSNRMLSTILTNKQLKLLSYSYTTDTSDLSDMYTRSPSGIYIRQTTSGHSITVSAIATPHGKQKAVLLALQVHNLILQSNLTTLPIY